MLSLIITGGGVEDRLQEAFAQKSTTSFILDGQTESILIEHVKEFQKQLSLTQVEQGAHFILEAQNLTLPAQHALLKTLEEPQENIQLVLTVDKPGSLLETILSRCKLRHLSTTPQELSRGKTLIQDVLKSNYGQLINLSTVLIKNDPQGTLKELLFFLQQSLRTKASLKRAQALRLTQTCITDLQSNLNPQLTLDNFLIELKALML